MFDIKIEILRRVSKVTINDHVFIVGNNSIPEIHELNKWLIEVHHSLKQRNNYTLSRLFKPFGFNKFRFNCIMTLFAQEFRDHVLNICDFFLNNKVRVNASRIAKFILFDDLEKSCLSKPQVHTEARSLFEPFSQEYNDKLWQIFIKACQQQDQNTVWKVAPMIGEKTIYQKLKINKDHYRIYKEYLQFIGEEWKLDFRGGQVCGKHTFISHALFGKDHPVKHAHTPNLTKLKIQDEILVDIYNHIKKLADSYKFEDDFWLIIQKNIQGFNTYTFDFSMIDKPLREEWKSYMHYLLKETATDVSVVSTMYSHLKTALIEFNNLPYQHIDSLLNVNYFHVVHFANYLQQVENNGVKKYSLSTIAAYFSRLRALIDYLLEKKGVTNSNPFKKYRFRNVNSYSQGVSYIPEDVVKQLENKLHEIPKDYQNVWTIMMNTGMRFSDVQHLEEDCLHFDDELNLHILSYVIIKTEQARRNNGMSSYHKIPVNKPTVEAIENQRELTLDLRLLANTKKIFLTHTRFAIVPLLGESVSRSINGLCEKYQIRDSNNERFQYSNHMCRKTLTMDLLTEGYSVKQVADYLGHLNKETTEKYYRAISERKIAELDNQMWDKLFDLTLPNDVKQQYSEEERQSLFKEIKLGTRETPEGHGFCSKHISFGPCHKKKCVGCRMLITGPQKLPTWYKLYKEQEDYLNELEEQFKRDNVNDYENYRVYQQENRLLNIYKDTIIQLEKFAEENNIPYEREID